MEAVKRLMQKKESVEKELDACWAGLKQMNLTLDEPLVDNDGFPRSDVDVHRARILRNSIRTLKNDHSKLMREIEAGLKQIHAASKQQAAQDWRQESSGADEAEQEPQRLRGQGAARKAFATITDVTPASPAAAADVRRGDEVLGFGSVTVGNFSSLLDVASVAQASKDRPVRMEVRRGEQVVVLEVTPRTWDGRGLLGCQFTPTTI